MIERLQLFRLCDQIEGTSVEIMSNKEIVDQAWDHIERPCLNAQSKRIKIYERFGRALNKAMIKDKKKSEPDEEDKKNLKKFSEVVPIELFVSKVSQ